MIGIITESISCMTRQDCVNLKVRLMPLSYVVEGKSFPDGIAEDRNCPTGAYSVAPTAAAYYKVFGEYVARGYRVICLTSSPKISSSYGNAAVASKAYPAGRIAVVDSGGTAGALHLLAQRARELERSGAGFTDIVQILTRLKKQISVSFSMQTITTLRDARRLSRVMHTGATPILNQKPVCIIENGAILFKKSVSGGFGEIRELCEAHTAARRVIVHYGTKDAVTGELIRTLRRRYPNAEILQRPVTMALRANLGDGILGVVTESLVGDGILGFVRVP